MDVWLYEKLKLLFVINVCVAYMCVQTSSCQHCFYLYQFILHVDIVLYVPSNINIYSTELIETYCQNLLYHQLVQLTSVFDFEKIFHFFYNILVLYSFSSGINFSVWAVCLVLMYLNNCLYFIVHLNSKSYLTLV